MGSSRSRSAERAAGCQRAHHHVRARVLVSSVLVGPFETPAEQLDGQQCEMIAERAFANEDLLLRQFRDQFPVARQ